VNDSHGNVFSVSSVCSCSKFDPPLPVGSLSVERGLHGGGHLFRVEFFRNGAASQKLLHLRGGSGRVVNHFPMLELQQFDMRRLLQPTSDPLELSREDVLQGRVASLSCAPSVSCRSSIVACDRNTSSRLRWIITIRY